MRRSIVAALGRLKEFRQDQQGVTAITVALMATALLGTAGFALDLGHLELVKQQLQSSADAAALAGGYNIPSNTAIATATAYSAAASDKNAFGGGVTVTMVSGYPVLKCLTSTGVTCEGTELSGGANAIQVSEQAVVPTWFAQVFGINAFTAEATATASAKGGASGSQPMNVMIVLDTTASMTMNHDNSCGLGSNSTSEQCALAGVRTLMEDLNPATDYVGIMVFPGVQNATDAANDYTCGASGVTSAETAQYNNSPDYQIVPLSNDFKTSSTATSLNSSSKLARAVGQGGAGCNSGITAPGGQTTYYAGAINAAQAALEALSATQSPPGQNVIILLSDGDANSVKTQTKIVGYIGSCASHGLPSCSASNVLTVTSCTNGCSSSSNNDAPIQIGEEVTGNGVAAGTTITSQLTGSTGGAGTYQVSVSQQVGNGQMTATPSLTMNGYTFDENVDECQQAIAAAQAAAKAGTWVYAVAYGSNTSGNGASCNTDTSSVISGMQGLSACTAMQDIANSPSAMPDPTKFYSDSNASNGQDCPGAQTIDNLTSLFKNLASSLSKPTMPRLLPNNTV
jgi:Flp pilus assembly protein TadG